MLDAALARRLRLVGFDVDGVLTDGGVYLGRVGDHAVELKRFDIQDGLGVKLLRAAGLTVVLVSGRVSEATTLRAREIGVDEVIQDDGAAEASRLSRRSSRGAGSASTNAPSPATTSPTCRVLTPGRASRSPSRTRSPEVKAAARYVTTAPGGRGAVREIAEAILKARGAWDGLVRQYLEERGDAARHGARSR